MTDAECWTEVEPELRPEVRALCRRPYYGHPKGCPNWAKRPTCPPQAPLLPDVLELSQPVYCVWNAFDLAGHVSPLRERHPDWSERQLRCVLY